MLESLGERSMRHVPAWRIRSCGRDHCRWRSRVWPHGSRGCHSRFRSHWRGRSSDRWRNWRCRSGPCCRGNRLRVENLLSRRLCVPHARSSYCWCFRSREALVPGGDLRWRWRVLRQNRLSCGRGPWDRGDARKLCFCQSFPVLLLAAWVLPALPGICWMRQSPQRRELRPCRPAACGALG